MRDQEQSGYVSISSQHVDSGRKACRVGVSQGLLIDF